MAAPLKTLLSLTLLSLATLTAGHGAIIAAVGDAGGSGMALGVDTSTPRDGTRRNPFQQDSTRFRGAAADTFGETLGGGNNQLEAGTSAILAETGDALPQVTAGGQVEMTLHQVNADGAGPYTCMINADGTGADWADITVVQNVPGRNSRNRVCHFPFDPFDLSIFTSHSSVANTQKRMEQKPITPSRPPSQQPRPAPAPSQARTMSAWCAARMARAPDPLVVWCQCK